MKKLNIIQPGTKVWVKSNQPFCVEVCNVHIITKNMLVTYDVSWWEGTCRKELSLNESDIELQENTTVAIGFGNS
jgi:hypothetical protein